jgi:phospholipid/cholesterol/gamma-HCH transport system substrate-binding protein
LNELKVGFLTLLAIASIVVVSLKITSNKANFGEFIEYQTIINDATGIYENSSIKVAGIVAGRIKTIQLSGSQALIKFEILQQIKITQFARLRIKTVGFLGDKYIDVYLGNPESPRLKEFSMVKAQAGAGFEQIGKDASEILKDVKVIAAVIKESLYTDDKKNAIKQIIAQINQFSHNANDISISLKRILKDNEGKISNTINNLNRVTSQLAFETDRYQEGSFMNDLDDVGPILDKVNQSVSDLREIVADVKAGKGTVGKLLRDEEVIDQVSATLAGVNKIVGRVNRFKTDIAIYTGGNNKEGSKTEVELDLMPSPERFFRFGVALGDGTLLEQEKTTTTTLNGGSASVENEKEVDKNIWRYNLQVGRKVNQFAFRIGLIESTGGLGVDYFIPEIGMKATIEGYDNRTDIGLNVRVSTEIRVWNIIHAKFMAEDMARASEFQVYTISAGLKFSDEDLASLIGLAI